jgi:hypothetical protein
MVSTPEMRFQVLCCPSAGGHNRDLIRDLPAPDWSLLLNLASLHGMMPLLASQLLSSGASSPCRSDMPGFVIKALRGYQERRLFRSITQTAALIELQGEFDRAALRVLPWKGPSVGVLLYGSATLRESVDLDFLFLEEDIPQVLQIARSLGYQLLQSTDSESKDVYILAMQREFTFARERDQLFLEFHLQILSSRFSRWQDARADIERASTVCQLASVEILMQSPEDLLVSLCAHATKHNWDRLKWSCDIVQFLSVYGDRIDWGQLFASLRKARKHSVVLLGLAVAANLFDRQLPSAVQEALQGDAYVALLARDVAAYIMSGATEPIEIHYRKAMIRLLCPRLRDRIAFTLLPIIELNYEDLYVPVQNRTLFFMNYVFRAFRLLRKYGPHRLATKTAVSVRSVR